MNKSGTIRAGVMGWPVGHSLSPRLHGFWLDHYGIDGSYEALAVKPEDFSGVFRRLADDGFAGVNITVPHKEAALANVDAVDEVATRIGAVNTVVVQQNGSLRGTNSDAFGFMENLKAGAPSFSPDQGPAVVLGAGGAARAVAVALLEAGAAEIRLLNRTRERAEELARHVGGPITVMSWDERDRALATASLLVNTTSLGMQGQPPLQLDLSALPKTALVTDIVYAPLDTPLLEAARARGHATVDGLGMLLHQARLGFEAWFGVAPAVTEALRRHVIAGLET